jgi:hypothetical protein
MEVSQNAKRDPQELTTQRRNVPPLRMDLEKISSNSNTSSGNGDNGSGDTSRGKRVLSKRKSREEDIDDDDGNDAPLPVARKAVEVVHIIQYTNADVLSGARGSHVGNVLSATRGGFSSSHVGNKMYRDLCHASCSEFQQLTANEDMHSRQRIGTEIVSAIRDAGGRFLMKKRTFGPWYELTTELAIVKTVNAMHKFAASAPAAASSSTSSSSSSFHKPLGVVKAAAAAAAAATDVTNKNGATHTLSHHRHPPSRFPIGTAFAKYFESAGEPSLFKGWVVTVPTKDIPYYFVRYEDGDEEDLPEIELQDLLVS